MQGKQHRLLLTLCSAMFTLLVAFKLPVSFGNLVHNNDTVLIHADSSSSKADSSGSSSSNNSSNSGGSSSSSSSQSDQSAQDKQDPWTTAVGDLSSKYNLDGSDNPLSSKDNVLGNVYSYLGPQNDVFTKSSKSSTLLNANFGSNGNDSNDARGAANRALSYGSTLNVMGIDHSLLRSDKMVHVDDFARKIAGGLLDVLYMGVIVADILLGSINNVLQYVNPLDWLAKAPTTGPFAGVGETLQGIAQSLQNFGIIFWGGMMVIAIILSVLGFRFSSRDTHVPDGARGRGSEIAHNIMHYAMRLFYMIVLPILCAGILDEVLQGLGDAYSNDVLTTSTYPIYANLVDFQGSVEHSRLALPNSMQGIEVSLGHSNPVATQAQVLDFNAQSAGRANAKDAQSAQGSGFSKGDGANTVKGSVGEINSAAFSTINDWRDGIKYTGADYANFVEGHTKDNTISDVKDDASKDLEGSDGKPSQYVTNGTLTGQKTYNTASPNSGTGKIMAEDQGGLSTVGMFNYMELVFQGGIATYSVNADQESSFDKSFHYSIGLAGRGTVAMTNYLLMVVELGCITLFGIFTGLAALSALVTGVIKLIMYLIATKSGMLRGAVMLVQTVLMLLVEYGGGALLWIFGIHMILGFGSSANTLFPDPNNTGATGLSALVHGKAVMAGVSTMGYSAYQLFVCVLLCGLTWMLLKVRPLILRMFNEASEHAVQTVLGSPDRHFGKGANLTTNEAQNGLTYDHQGHNDLDKLTEDTNAAGSGRGGRGGQSDGHSQLSGAGQYQQSTRNANPHGIFAKAKNYKQAKKDRELAAEKTLGRPLTDQERKHVDQQFRKERVGNAAYRSAGRVLRAAGMNSAGNALINHAENREAKQQIDTYNAMQDAQKNSRALDKEAREARKNEREMNDIQQEEQKTADQAQNATDMLADAATDAMNEGSSLDDAVDQSMSQQYGDEFKEFAKTGGSINELKSQAAQDQQTLQQAQQDLASAQSRDLAPGESKESRDADIQEKQAAVTAAQAQADKSQSAVMAAAQNVPVSESIMQPQSLREGVSSFKNVGKQMGAQAVDMVTGSNTMQQHQAMQGNTQGPTTISQASTALNNIADARHAQQTFLDEHGSSVATWSADDKQQYTSLLNNTKQAETVAKNLGLNESAYDTTQHLHDSQNLVNHQLDQVINGNTMQRNKDIQFEPNQLKNAIKNDVLQRK